jgi:DNA ligase-1
MCENLEDYNIVQEYPVLYGVEKNNKIKQWNARILLHKDGNKSLSEIKFGQLNGKLQFSYREYISGKNIGKKNETTPLEQCINETKKKWTDKQEKEGYSTNIDSPVEEKDEKYFPMLAQTYEPNTQKNKKNDIVFPCFVQPKLDGLRCIVYFSKSLNKIVFQSRTGAYFDTMEHIISDIKNIHNIINNNDIILDGELYTTDMPFEELAGLIKKKKINDKDKEKLRYVKYHIYDIINDETFEKRFNYINFIFSKLNFNYIEKVNTIIANTVEEFKYNFSNFVEDRYEGIILRNVKGLYRTNYRSHDLQKYKEFKEDEYEIVGFKEGDGRDKGTVIWICKTNNNTFSVRPKGSLEYRKELYENSEKYIGKKLTVIYQELSEMGIPRFPVGKSIRENF